MSQKKNKISINPITDLELILVLLPFHIIHSIVINLSKKNKKKKSL